MIEVNGTDLGALGFIARRRRLPRLGGQSTATSPIPGTVGAVATGGAGSAGRLIVEGSAMASDRAALLDAIDAITRAVQGECVIRLSDLPGREWHGILQSAQHPAIELDPQWTSRAARLTLDWLLPDPTAVATAPTVLPGDATLVLGTAPCPIGVTVQAEGAEPVTQIVVTVYAGGRVLRSLTWQGELSAPSIWRVDDESHAVTVDGANAIDGLAADSDFPYADPAEGADRITVETTGGQAQAIVHYYRRWY